MTELPYERAAMANEPIPSGLSLTDRKLYVALRWLYREYHDKHISREQAQRDKAALLVDYRRDQSDEKREKHLTEMWMNIESAARAYAKTPGTPEGDAFFAAVYGLGPNWRHQRHDTD